MPPVIESLLDNSTVLAFIRGERSLSDEQLVELHRRVAAG
jgi:hypothetical protein